MPELHTGISMFDSVAGAQSAAQRLPFSGYICEVAIPSGQGIQVRQTLGPGHHTVWGDALTLLGCVTRVV